MAWFFALSSRIAFTSRALVPMAPATAALPRMRLAVGMVARTVPAATVALAVVWVRTSPPAAVKAAVTPGARKRGCAEAVSRHTARVIAIKP